MNFTLLSSMRIGLHIETMGFRLVELAKKRWRDHYEVLRCVETKLNQDGSRDVPSVWDQLTEQLSVVVKELGLTNYPAAISFPAHRVRMQTMKLPAGLSTHEVEADLEAQVKRDLSGLSQALTIDFCKKRAADPRYQEVFFTVAKQADLAPYIQCASAAGLSVKIVDIDLYALLRAVTWLRGFSAAETEVLLNVHEKQATLIVFDAEQVLFHQAWEVAEPHDLWLAFHQRLQSWLTTYSKTTITRVTVCSEQQTWMATMQAIANTANASHYCYQWLMVNESHPPVDTLNTLKANQLSARHLIALGLALREVPEW